MSSPRESFVRRAILLLLRSGKSTMIISGVALAVAVIRRGRLDWSEVSFTARQNWRLGAAVFLGVVVWEFWRERTNRPRLADQAGQDDSTPS